VQKEEEEERGKVQWGNQMARTMAQDIFDAAPHVLSI